MSTEKTVFEQNLTKGADGIKETRAKRLAGEAIIAQQAHENKLKMEEFALKNRLEDLEDLNPETTDSLRPGGGNFNATQWIKEVNEITLNLLDIEIRIKAAEQVSKKYFISKASE